MKKKYESSKKDKAADKAMGIKEGSRRDIEMDKMMEGSPYKHDRKLGRAMKKM